MPLTKRRLPSRLRSKVEAALCLCLVSAGFVVPKSLLLRHWIDNALNRVDSAAENCGQSRAMAHDIESAARRLPFKTRCLQRSIALSWMLRRRGLGGQLRFGVRTAGDRILAHAWIELAGEPVNDAADHCAAFTVLEPSQRLPDGVVLAEDAA